MDTAGIFKDEATGQYYFSPDRVRQVVKAVLAECAPSHERIADFVAIDLLTTALDAEGVPQLPAVLE